MIEQEFLKIFTDKVKSGACAGPSIEDIIYDWIDERAIHEAEAKGRAAGKAFAENETTAWGNYLIERLARIINRTTELGIERRSWIEDEDQYDERVKVGVGLVAFARGGMKAAGDVIDERQRRN